MSVHGQKILFIEDEEDTRKVYTDFFQRRAETVINAKNGHDGLAKFLEYKPDLVITDIRMPDMNGIELINAIREIDVDVPIVVFSAYVSEEFLIQEIKDQVHEVVAKPAKTTVLSEIIDGALFKSRARTNVEKDQIEQDYIEKYGDEPSVRESITNHKDLILVGIGASAGGLEALTALVKGLPAENNTAYLIAQHLSPTHKTMLVDLLSRETNLKVKDAEHGIKVEADTIYITPPNKNIEVNSKDQIVLSAPESHSFLPKPSVNQLFFSLAEYKKDRAIGIILSGTGSDGAQGMRAINAEGGITIVQEPTTAKYDGMPQASIQGCSIDIVIEAGQIGEELVALSNFPRHKVLKKFQLTQPNDEMTAIFGLLYKYKKVDFSVYKKATIGRRIERRMVTTKATTLQEYLEILRADEKEVVALFKDILIGVTSFFRDTEAYSALGNSLAKYLVSHPELTELRVWSPGSSTGEEAYSVMITIMELLEFQEMNLNLRMFATDVDEDALKTARRGVFSEASMAEVDETLIKKYFNIENNEFVVKDMLREHIVFSSHNLLSDPPFKDVDLIVCRNLLIYFTMEAQSYVMPMFHYALRENGLLFLGKSENATNFEHFFAPDDKKNKIFKQITSTKKSFLFTKPREYKPKSHSDVVHLEATGPKKSLRDTTLEEAVNVLLPSVIVTNQQLEVLYKKGSHDYLKIPDGIVTYNLYKMVDPRLSVDIRALVSSIQQNKTSVPCSTSFIPIPADNGAIRYLKIHLVSVLEKNSLLYVFYFQELSMEDMPTIGVATETADYSGDRFLELELERTKEHMQTLVEELETANEELQSTNEELQSTNEELQSTNEELETSNEELQSTNEELQTAYAELKEMYSANNKVKDDYQFLNQRYERLLENINDGVVVSRLDGLIIRVNRSMEYISECRQDKLLTMSWFDLDANDCLSDCRANLVKDGSAGPYELNLVTPKGEIKTLSIQDFLIKGTDGKPHIWSFLKDITSELQYKRELLLSEKKYKTSFQFANTGIAHVDLDGNWLTVNAKLREIFGYTEDEMLRVNSKDITHPDDLAEDQELIAQLKSGEIDSYKIEKRCYRKDGTLFWALLSVSLVHDVDDAPQYFLKVIEDISQSKEEALRARQARVVFNSTQEGILVTDKQTKIIAINPALTSITGYEEDELVGKKANIFKSGIHPESFYDEMWHSISLAGFWSGEVINRAKDGQEYSAYLNINSVRDDSNEIAQYIAVLTDISLIKQSQRKIEFVANHDLLTKLPNRALLMDRLSHAIDKAKREMNNLALLFIDLDRFKVVNDGLGHDIGDKVLIETGKRFQEVLRDTDTISRIGGDEFLAILEGINDPMMARKVAQHIIDSIGEVMMIDGHEIKIGASIGISIYPSHAVTADELVRQADIAMYEAKRSGRSAYRFASDDLSSSAMEKATMERSIRKGLMDKEFFLEFHPVIRLDDSSLDGLEALIRWRHPEFGLVMPSKFIGLAEESDLISQITEYVAYEAINGLKQIAKQTGIMTKVALNFAARDFDNSNLYNRLKQFLTRAKVSPKQLTIELTERKFLLGNERQRTALQRYTDLGIGMAIDDFGTGYSNLSYLSDLPINVLKIDRSFVSKIGSDNKAEEIVKATINIAKSLDMESVAEGVETSEQLEFLKNNGCTLAQGFYFSATLPLDELIERLSQSTTFNPHAKA